LLKEMKEGTKSANEERQKAGYPPVDLVGWRARHAMTPPRTSFIGPRKSSSATKPEHTLNYNIRMLGRRGVLILNAVATMPQLKEVEAAAPTLLKMVDFQEGNRYADFKQDTDKVATYGIAALVAGGIAAKAGFFKLLWVGILAFKKVIILAVIALGSYFKKMWDWVRGRHAATPETGPTPPAAPASRNSVIFLRRLNELNQ